MIVNCMEIHGLKNNCSIKICDNTKKTAILIESDKNQQIIIKNILFDLGFNVKISDRSIDAVMLLSSYTYDLIVMRDNLPHVNALLLIKLISFGRQFSRNKNSNIFVSLERKNHDNDIKKFFKENVICKFLEYPININSFKKFFD